MDEFLENFRTVFGPPSPRSEIILAPSYDEDAHDYKYDFAGWSRRLVFLWCRLCADNRRVQRIPLHSWRLNVIRQWDEVQHQVRFKTQIETNCHLPSPLPRDRNLNPDRDIFNCARERTGGWWYNAPCTEAHLTGMHTETEWSRIEGSKQLYWWFRGEKGDTHNSFAEVEMLLLPNWPSLPNFFFIWSVQTKFNYENKLLGGNVAPAWRLPFCDQLFVIYKLLFQSTHQLNLNWSIIA